MVIRLSWKQILAYLGVWSRRACILQLFEMIKGGAQFRTPSFVVKYTIEMRKDIIFFILGLVVIARSDPEGPITKDFQSWLEK